MKKIGKSLMKVFCLCLFVMFCSTAYLPVLDMGLKGIAGESGVAFAKGEGEGKGKGKDEGKDKDKDKDKGEGKSYPVPEPSILALLGAGAAGVGIYAAIKRRKK